MKKGVILKPSLSRIIRKTLVITFPSMCLVIFALFFLMYHMDRAVFKKTIEAEVHSLVETANTYDGYDYTKTDLFYSRMKEALLSYAERCGTYHTYAVIVNHDKIVTVSTKEALRAYILSNREDSGGYYYCEEESVLQWVREEWKSELEQRPAHGLVKGIYLEDAYLCHNWQFIPGTMHKYTAVYQKDGGTGPSKLADVDEICMDFSDLVDPRKLSTHILCDRSEEENYHIILEDSPRGTKPDAPVFYYVDQACGRLDYQKRIGDMEVYYQIKLNHGSDSLVLFSGGNVFQMYHLRYLSVASMVLGITFLCCLVFIILRYQNLKNLYANELFRTTLLSRLSHDLRTPLAAMVGYSENLLDNIATEKKEHYAASILHNARYMNDIIQKVMVLSKTEIGDLPLHRESVDLMERTRRAWDTYEDLAKDRGMSISCQGECTLYADQFLMDQMIENLISNAVMHASPQSQICVIGTKDCYQIMNSCDKKSNSAPEELWKPFVKAEPARSNRTGSGIGLTIVKNICTLHGLCVEIRFEQAIFCVRIKMKKEKKNKKE